MDGEAPTADDSLVMAREFRLAIGRAARRLRRVFLDSGDGLAFLELGILHHLARSGPASPGTLADNEGVTGPAIAETLRHLESLGLVHRSRDPADGRRVVVTISDAGRESLADRDAAVLGRVHEILSTRLDDPERALIPAITQLLEKVAAEL